MTRKFVCRMDHTFSTRVCNALGLDPMMVHRLIIDFKVDNIAVIHVTMFADEKINEIEFNGNDFEIVEREKDA